MDKSKRRATTRTKPAKRPRIRRRKVPRSWWYEAPRDKIARLEREIATWRDVADAAQRRAHQLDSQYAMLVGVLEGIFGPLHRPDLHGVLTNADIAAAINRRLKVLEQALASRA